MDQVDKTRKLFLVGTGILGVLIVGGLVWAIAMGPGEGGGRIDSNVVFNDDSNPSKGPADAKVTVRVFSDFQCPACKYAEPAMEQIMKEYEGKVRFVWNDTPLMSIHANAQSAAIAGRCAQEQGKFWELASKLFENQQSWAKLSAPSQYFIDLAKGLGLDEGSFATCLSQDAPKMKVSQDLKEATAIGVEATPTFFVNRSKYEGALDVSQWRSILDAELKK